MPNRYCSLCELKALQFLYHKFLQDCVGFIDFPACRVFDMSLSPKPFRDFKRIDFEVLPPGFLITDLMKLPVMTPAQRYGEFITHF